MLMKMDSISFAASLRIDSGIQVNMMKIRDHFHRRKLMVGRVNKM